MASNTISELLRATSSSLLLVYSIWSRRSWLSGLAQTLVKKAHVLCTALDLILPAYQMHTVWERLLPGFVWISVGSFVLGLVESIAYGWYFALIWVPIYNVVLVRREQRTAVPK